MANAMFQFSIHSKSQEIELNMIKNDIYFYHDLALQVMSGNSAGILMLGLIPYLSLFVVETYAYIYSKMPNDALRIRRQHEDVLRASRTRIKLFDDKQRDIVEFINFMSWISDFHSDWFIKSHRGPFAWLKRLFQPDLGLFIYEDHLICTTHVAFFNLGYEEQNLPAPEQGIEAVISKLSHSIGFEIGEYIGHLFRGFGLDPRSEGSTLCRYGIIDEFVQFKDAKSHKYYRSIFNGPSSMHINSCLVLFLVTINFLKYILSNFVVGIPDTFFKLKFITLYHLTSSLNKLQDYYYSKGLFTKRSREFLKEILADRDLRRIKSRSNFRNILVHYSIRGIPEERLTPHTRLFGLVEHFFDGDSFEDLNSLLDHQITRICRILEDWLH